MRTKMLAQESSCARTPKSSGGKARHCLQLWGDGGPIEATLTWARSATTPQGAVVRSTLELEVR